MPHTASDSSRAFSLSLSPPSCAQIASFVRQLNLYKMVRMSQLALLEDLNDSGGRIEGELTHTGFSHPHLQRGHPELLHKIKRESLLCFTFR